MAIDDIKLEQGPCNNFGACSFENLDYCGTWSNVIDYKRDQFDWEFGSGQTSTQGTGPNVNYRFYNL